MTPREPDRYTNAEWQRAARILDACLNGSHEHDEGGLVLAAESWRPIAAALRAAESSALERAARIARRYSHHAEREIRALIPPAAAPETQRDIPCGGCGHPLWWHQWSSRERFCSKPLNERDFCRCKNYQEPAAAPADEKDLRSATANEKLPAQVCVPSAAIVAPARGPWRVGNHYGIHVYEGDVPIATFHREEDARRCVDAVNGAPTEGNR